MSIIKALAFAGLALASLSAMAAQPVIDLGRGGKLTPGVYGEVKLGKTPPPLVNSEPKSIVKYTVPRKLEPIYLHVPPEHAQHWDKHCREYKACDRPTYFVKSREYEPGYVRPKSKIKAEKNDLSKAGQDKTKAGSGGGGGDGSGGGGGGGKIKTNKDSSKKGKSDGSGGGGGGGKN